MELYNRSMEPLAGLARIAWHCGNLPQAQVHVDEILLHLESSSLASTEEAFRVYLTCYRILRENRDPRARDMLQIAHGQLQARAATLEGPEQEQMFWQMAGHKQISREWSQFDHITAR
jgi:hypothetical protein